MKRNLLLLAVMILAVLAFSNLYAQCPQDANDNGNCDTLYLETWPGDATFSGPGIYKVSLYVLHDVTVPAVDSLAAFVWPLCYTHSNPAKYCSVSTYWNAAGGANAYSDRGIFRDLPSNATPTVANWMREMFLLGDGSEWDNLTLNLDGTSHYWLSMIAGGSDPRYADVTKRLLATIAFKLEDSMTVCIDSCFWPPHRPCGIHQVRCDILYSENELERCTGLGRVLP